MLQIPYLQAILACHIVRGRIPFEAGVKVYTVYLAWFQAVYTG